jgi:hypothetical protein
VRRRLTDRLAWGDYALAGFRWWRRLRGGAWTCWWIGGPVQSWMWFPERLTERPGLGRGRPHFEDYER